MATRCMLVMPDGASRRVGPKGVIVGRQSDCDIVGSDPAMSRRHALVRVATAAVEVLPLGTGTVKLNGAAIDRPHELADGDMLSFPGLVLSVDIDVASELVPTDPTTSVVLERERGGTFGFAHSPVLIGGGANDDVYIENWPPSALAFYRDGGGVEVELRALGERRPLAIGERVSYGDETFKIVAGGPLAAAVTSASSAEELPTKVVIEMLPRGGLIVFTIASGERTVYLSDRRFELLMALLNPPEGHEPGDILSDDALSSTLWPRKPTGRTEINTLISRCRRDLVEAGLNGSRLLQRAPGGGGTKFALARNADIVVKR